VILEGGPAGDERLGLRHGPLDESLLPGVVLEVVGGQVQRRRHGAPTLRPDRYRLLMDV